MTNKHHNDTDEDDHVKYHDNKDWNEKSTPEGSSMGQETAAIECLMIINDY